MNHKSNKLFWIGAICIILQGIIYGCSDPLVKMLLLEVPVFAFLPVRFFVSGCFIFLIWHRRILQELKNAPVKSYILPSLSMAFAYLFVNTALSLTQATNVSFIRSLTVIITPLLSCILLKRTPSREDVLTYSLVPVGLFLISMKGRSLAFDSGCICALCAAILVSVSLLSSPEARKYVSPITLSFTQILSSFLLYLVVGLLNHDFSMANIQPMFSWQLGLILLYAAIISTVGGYCPQNMAFSYITPETAGLFQCSYPLATALMAPLLIHESLTLAGYAGVLIILFCIIRKSISH